MKILKVILIAIPVLIILVIGAGAFFLSTLDLNSYKSLIVEKTQEATGRTLEIDGEIDHKLFSSFRAYIGEYYIW